MSVEALTLSPLLHSLSFFFLYFVVIVVLKDWKYNAKYSTVVNYRLLGIDKSVFLCSLRIQLGTRRKATRCCTTLGDGVARLSSLGSAQPHRAPGSRKPLAWAAPARFRAALPQCSSRCSPELCVCCDFREHGACKSLFSQHCFWRYPSVAVVPVVAGTAWPAITPVSLQAGQALVAAPYI